MSIDRLVRPHFRNFAPYKSARTEFRGAGVFLDANELAFGSPVELDSLQLNRYPDPLQLELRRELASLHRVQTDQVFAGVGSDEAIDLLIRLVCEPARDRIMVFEPTYGVYRVAAEINDVGVVVQQLTAEFQIELAGVEMIDPDVKIVFVCSPNNPTGNLLRKNDILQLCARARGLVVVDEAYIDFAGNGASIVNELARHENLVILRTLSKSYGLAGIRLGYALADQGLVEYLLKIKSPYNINALTSHVALKAITQKGFVGESVRRISEGRAWLNGELRKSKEVVGVYPSDANFLLVRFRDAGRVYRRLLDNNIIVRRRSEPRLEDCLRITVGTEDQNRQLMHVINA